MVEHLPGMCKALSSTTTTVKKNFFSSSSILSIVELLNFTKEQGKGHINSFNTHHMLSDVLGSAWYLEHHKTILHCRENVNTHA